MKYLGLRAHVDSPVSDVPRNDHVIAKKEDVLQIHRPPGQPQEKMFTSVSSQQGNLAITALHSPSSFQLRDVEPDHRG